MKEKLILVAKGFIIGVANIIPGVSGGTLAITLGIYEELIGAISHFFSNFKKNIIFLVPIGIGALLSILLCSNIIGYSLDHFPIPTILFFIGLILGGIPMLMKKVKGEYQKPTNIILFVITFVAVASFAFLKSGNHVVSFEHMNLLNYGMLMLVGIIAAGTMVIPGISGSFMLMLMGYYEPIINTIRSLTHFDGILENFMILIPFGIGVLIGIVLVAKLIEFLLKKFEIKTYFAILGFVLASIISILMGLGDANITVMNVIVGLLFGFGGFVIAYILGEK